MLPSVYKMRPRFGIVSRLRSTRSVQQERRKFNDFHEASKAILYNQSKVSKYNTRGEKRIVTQRLHNIKHTLAVYRC